MSAYIIIAQILKVNEKNTVHADILMK